MDSFAELVKDIIAVASRDLEGTEKILGSGVLLAGKKFLSQKLLILDRALLPAQQRQRPDPCAALSK